MSVLIITMGHVFSMYLPISFLVVFNFQALPYIYCLCFQMKIPNSGNAFPGRIIQRVPHSTIIADVANWKRGNNVPINL